MLTKDAPLTRRRSPHRDGWLVYAADVMAGSIVKESGLAGSEHWVWRCGFYPGSNPGERRSGTAATFEEARLQFERAWMAFVARRTEADFDRWRDHRDWTLRKYAAIDRGEQVPLR
ncbi:hypothetical protein [Bradyrhizobium valentinum]|nr:hypothetical protein [Bradyrhizobium valentinum]